MSMTYLLKPQYLCIDRCFEPAVRSDIGAVDPARAIRTEEGHDGRDVAGRAGPPDRGDVTIDTLVAEHLTELLEARCLDWPRADRDHADAARFVLRLVRSELGPQQQQLLAQRVTVAIGHVVS